MSRSTSSRMLVFDENATPSARPAGLNRLAPPVPRVPSSGGTRSSKIIPRSPVRVSRAKISSPSCKVTYERSSLSLKQEKPVAEEIKTLRDQVSSLEKLYLSSLGEEVAALRESQSTSESTEALLDQIRSNTVPLGAYEELIEEVTSLRRKLTNLEEAAQRSNAEIDALRSTVVRSERNAHARHLAEAGLHDAKLHALETDIQALRDALAQQKEVALVAQRMPRQEIVLWTVLVSVVLGAGFLRFTR